MRTLFAKDGGGDKVFSSFVRSYLYMDKEKTTGVLCLFLVLVFTVFCPHKAKARELTIVGAPYKPFLFIGSDGKLKGFDVDLINLLCATSGYDCKIETVPTFKDALDRLRNGVADLAIGAIYITENRKKEFLFTTPYLDTGLVAVTNASEDLSLKDLSGKTVGVKLGATGEKIAQRLATKYKGLKIKRYLTTEESFEALARGEVDLVLNDYLNSIYIILKKYPGQMTILKGLLEPVFFQKTQLAYPLRKDLTDVQNRFNQALDDLQRSKILDRLKQRWLALIPTWRYLRLSKILFFMIAGLFILAIVSLHILRQREMRKQAKNQKELLKQLPGAVFVVQDGRVRFFNPVAREIFKTPTFEMPIDRILPISQEEREVFTKPARLRSGRFEFIHNKRYYSCYYNPIEYNKKPAIQLFIYDITAERQAKESIKQLYIYQEAYNNILKRCSESESVEELLKAVVRELLTMEFLATKGSGMAYIFDEEYKQLIMVAQEGLTDVIQKRCHVIKEGEFLYEVATKERSPFFIASGVCPGCEGEKESSHGHWLIPIYDERSPLALLDLHVSGELQISPHVKGFLQSVMVALRDSIKRIRFKEHLEASLQTFHLAIENMPSPAIIYTNSGKVVYVNNRFKALMGEYIQEVEDIERIIKRLLPSEKAEKILHSLYQNEWTWLDNIEFFTSHNQRRLCNVSFGPIGSVKGEENYMFVLEDITEEEDLKKQLLQSQKLEAVGQLAGGVAHDFNNIINAVMGHAELALNRMDNKEALKRHLEGIIYASEKATLLTKQLLTFSRKQMISPRPLDINATVTEMLKFLRRTLREDIELVFEKEDNLPYIMADPLQIEQILLNLILNARDAMPDGGKITIKTERIDRHIVLSVSDTGCGIPEEIMDRIFEPFFSTKAEEGKGTGLGLSTVRAIVQELNGRIDVSSKPYRGTRFRIYLPAIEKQRQSTNGLFETTAMKPEKIDLSGEVLVIEDNPDVREVLRGYLEAIGLKVRIVEEPERALEAINDETELLIADIVMPDINGLTIAKEAKKIKPSLRVLLITGFIGDRTLLEKVENSGFQLLPKPFNMKQLTEALKRVISQT